VPRSVKKFYTPGRSDKSISDLQKNEIKRDFMDTQYKQKYSCCVTKCACVRACACPVCLAQELRFEVSGRRS
jgi:hypothetical protein